MRDYKPYVRVEGNCTYVIGTRDCQEAIRILGITPETHRWSSTDWGLWVRRQRRWQAASNDFPPKDAKPGVRFIGPIREKEK